MITPFFITWVVLTELSALSAVTILPYAYARINRRPTGRMVLRTFLLAQLIFGLVAGIGLALGRELGFGAPIITALASGGPVPRLARPAVGLAAGLVLAALLWALDVAFFSAARQTLRAARIPTPSLAMRFGAALYGAISEEVLLRLGLLTSVAFVMQIVLEAPTGGWTNATAVVLSALAFAAGHLPALARTAKPTAKTVIRLLLLNGVAGLLFGSLYIWAGLEAAMAAHGGLDLIVVVLIPGLTRCKSLLE